MKHQNITVGDKTYLPEKTELKGFKKCTACDLFKECSDSEIIYPCLGKNILYKLSEDSNVYYNHN